MTNITRSQEVAGDVAALFRARNPLIWIVSREEARVERYLAAAAAATKHAVTTWDVAAGFRDGEGEPLPIEGSQDPGVALAWIDKCSKENGGAGVWIMRDLPAWLAGPQFASTLRQLRNLARDLPFRADNPQVVVVLSPGSEVPPELANHATVIEWPLPDREEIGSALDEAMAAQGDRVEPLNGKRDAAIDASVGLTEEEALACFGRSLVQLKKIDPVVVAREKRRVIARERVLEWHDPLPGGLDAVGGLENLKGWLMERTDAYSPEARAYGLPMPKGLLIVGIPGTGKSLTAKAVSTAWGCPLIKMDLGALKSKFVGDSEANIRKAFKVIEALGRCVVWLDEIEKSMQGATSGSSDGGTSSDQLGAILNWMQERAGAAFVIATANDVTALPPELIRKGRFDEMFFVDLPTKAERVAIARATLRGFKQDLIENASALDMIADATDGFTGAEIAAVIPEAMFASFADGKRALRAQDVTDAARKTVPLSRTAPEKIKRLQDWAQGKARPASVTEKKAAGPRVRALAID